MMHEHALLQWAGTRGYEVAWGPVSAIEYVREELAARIAAGELDGRFARESLSAFEFAIALPAGAPWTPLVIAVPRPAHLVRFRIDGERVEALIPPIYVRYRETFEDVRQDLLSGPLAGAQVLTLNVPLKGLAARLALLRYGRNNVGYVGSRGSYFQLVGYLTDAELPIDGRPLREPQLLEDCEDCAICSAVCPTDAIGEDRVLLHAERCLTLANESAAPFPEWIGPSAHHTLIGCLQCQRSCPANPELPVEDTGLEFSQAETVALLQGEMPDAVAPGLNTKLDRLALLERALVGRNLAVLLAARRLTPGNTLGGRA